MKKVFIIACCFITSVCYSQSKRSTKKYRSTYKARVSYNVSLDSARYYYLKGWDAYKQNNYGDARYYWERGSNCYSNIPSRYSCAFRLGLMHQNGEGIGVNYGIAYYYYNLAYANGMAAGDNEATKILGAYYENGLFVMPDYRKSLEWYQKAKKQGNKNCDDDIARLKQRIAENS